MGLAYASLVIVELVGGSIIYVSRNSPHSVEGFLVGAVICVLGVIPFFDP